jgi:lipoprotein NlpD
VAQIIPDRHRAGTGDPRPLAARWAGPFAAPRSLLLCLALLVCLGALLLGGCGPAWTPVEKRPGAAEPRDLTADGRYRVRRGDSLYTIAFNFGLDWRDIADWNSIRSPYVIYPDQELQLAPPPVRSAQQVVTRPAPPPAGSTSKEQRSSGSVGGGVAGTATTSPAVAAPSVKPGPKVAAKPPSGSASAPLQDPGRWLWPTEGRLLSSFKANEPARNGIEIAGREGQAIKAAAPGEVVYSGNGLIGYGELIIVKHSDRMLSAYAHNRKRLVNEGQTVAAGELLAEMGRDERNKALLHFEIRVNGAPQDPMKYLPKR